MATDVEKIDPNIFYGLHNPLAEELLMPHVDKTQCNRITMFNGHLPQTVVLKNPEIPKIFTNFENQFGEYSSSYKVADQKMTVLHRVIRNDMNYTLIVKRKDGVYDIIDRKPCDRITEHYGYEINNELDKHSAKKGENIIKKGEILYKSTAYDEDLNFKYGTNINAAYLSFKNMTFEDAIVISESAAKKFTSFTIKEFTININKNDILVNLYGNNKFYKCFPDIGEKVKNRTLLARRRIDYDSFLSNMHSSALMKINYHDDKVFYSEEGDSVVVDVEVFSNTDINTLSQFRYNNQILKYLKACNNYYERIVEVLEPIIESNKKYSDDLGHLYTRAKGILNDDIKWTNDKSNFDNIIIKIKVLKEEELCIGSKLTGRYGNKGCVSAIVPDSEMPISEDGERIDVCLSPLGVINRLNPSQLFEIHLNAMSKYIVSEMKKLYDEDKLDEMSELFFDYIYDVNQNQYSELIDYYNALNYEESIEFWNDIFENGIYLHQPPFWGNLKFDDAMRLKQKYPNFKPKKFIGIEKPLICGEIYMIKLKHEPAGKFSVRSSSYLNLKNIPSKSTSFKDGGLYSTTPIKIGEMELTNMFITKDIKNVVKFLETYSTNEFDRQNAIKTLLTTDNPYNIDEIPSTNTRSKTSHIIDVYLKNMGLYLDREDDEDSKD